MTIVTLILVTAACSTAAPTDRPAATGSTAVPTPDPPAVGHTEGDDDDVTVAERVFVDCLADHGLRPETVEFGPDGVQQIRFPRTARRELISEWMPICERRALKALGDQRPEPAPVTGPPATAAELKQYLDAQHFPGSVRVDVAGRSLLVAEPNTVYDIGSITKTFTAAAVLTLVDADRMALDTTVADVLADVPPDKAKITVEQLLTHRSGLREYIGTAGDFDPMTKAQALHKILRPRLLFEPDTDQAYSNAGYTLLAALVEEVTGSPFQHYVRTEVLKPAGLDSMGFYGDPRLGRRHVAIGTGGRTKGPRNAPDAWGPVSWSIQGSGGIAGSVNDLAKWVAAQRDGRAPNVSRADAVPTLELVEGIEVRPYAGGNDYGFEVTVVELPDGFVITATNANPPDEHRASDLAFALSRMVLGAEPD